MTGLISAIHSRAARELAPISVDHRVARTSKKDDNGGVNTQAYEGIPASRIARTGTDGIQCRIRANRPDLEGSPTLVIIDRQGKLAFHSGIGAKEDIAAIKALARDFGLDESTMTDAELHRLWEAFFGAKIEKILNRP